MIVRGTVKFSGVVLALGMAACTSMPDPHHTQYSFPDSAYVEIPKKPFQALGEVRAKVNFTSLDPNHELKELCQNYYNEAVQKLVKTARKNGGEAVMEVRSVVFYYDGRAETLKGAECSDDGEEGQILVRGVAIRWKKENEKADAVPAPEPIKGKPAIRSDS